MDFFDLIAPIYELINLGANKIFKILNELDEFHKTDKVLDLGGGSGRVSKFFINKVEEIIVLDPSSSMIRKCERRQGLSCIIGEAENIPFPDNYFNKIIIINALHHFKDQEAACREIKRVLKTNGRVLIREFNPKTILGRIIVKEERLLKMESKFYFPKSLAAFFEKYNFTTKIINENKGVYYLIGEKSK